MRFRRDNYQDAADAADHEASLGGRWCVVEFFSDRHVNDYHDFAAMPEAEAHALVDDGVDCKIQYTTDAD
jgi:hypothetical protein